MPYKFEVLTAVDKKIHLSVLVTYPHLSILMIYPESPTCSRPHSSFVVNQSKAAHELARSAKSIHDCDCDCDCDIWMEYPYGEQLNALDV